MFLELFNDGGVWSWFMLFVEMLLIPLGIALLFFHRRRNVIIIFIILSIFPVLIGAVGTFIGYQEINEITSSKETTISPEIIQESKEVAKTPLKLGLWFSPPLIILGLVSFSLNHLRHQTAAQQATSDKVGMFLFLKRFTAFVIDYIIVLLGFLVISFILLLSFDTKLESEDETLIDLMASIIALVLMWLYYALLESSSKQATLGKMILGIVVTDLDGKRITFGKGSIRFWSKIISNLTMGIGYFMVLLTDRNQALHDLFAKCLITNKSRAPVGS